MRAFTLPTPGTHRSLVRYTSCPPPSRRPWTTDHALFFAQAACCTVSCSDWLNSVVGGDFAGNALVYTCNNWNRSTVSLKKMPRLLLFQSLALWNENAEDGATETRNVSFNFKVFFACAVLFSPQVEVCFFAPTPGSCVPSRPVTKGAQGGSLLQEKCVGHSLKSLGPAQKKILPSWCPKQAGCGPGPPSLFHTVKAL